MNKFISYILLFSPLIFFAYTPWTLYPAIFGRTIIFQVCIEVILIVIILNNLFKRLVSSPESRIRNQESGIKNQELWGRTREIFFSPIGAGLIIFTLVQFASYFTSVDREASFWGSMSRMDGIFTWLHMVIFYFLLVLFLSNKSNQSNWTNLFWINTLVASILSGLAVIQHFHDLVPKYIIQSGRVYATFGNPVFFATYLIFTIFIILYLLLEVEVKPSANINAKQVAKYFSISLLVILQIVALFWTGSQGAIGGFLVGILVSGLAGLIKLRKKIKPIQLGGVLVLGILIMFISIFKLNLGQFIRSPQFSNIEGLEARISVWKMGLEGVGERPIFGFGPSTFEYVFDKYYNPELLRHSFYETVSNKPHNILIETLNHTGFVGLISYLVIFIVAIVTLWKIRKSDFKLAAIGFGLLVAYFGALQFSFDTTNSWFMLMVFLAYITHKSEIRNLKSETISNDQNQKLKTVSNFEFRISNFSKIAFKITSILVLFCAMWFGNIEAWAASMPGARAENKYWFQKPIKWALEAKKALEARSPYHDEIRIIMAQDLIRWEALGSLPMIEIQDQAHTLTSKLEESTAQHSNNFQYLFTLAQIQGIETENFGTVGFNKAINSARQALQISLNRQAAYLILGKLLLQNGDLEGAEESANKAIKLYESAPEPHWFFGIIKSAEGALDEAVQEFKLAHKLGYNFKPQEIIYWMSINKKRGQEGEDEELRRLLEEKTN